MVRVWAKCVDYSAAYATSSPSDSNNNHFESRGYEGVNKREVMFMLLCLASRKLSLREMLRPASFIPKSSSSLSDHF